ncbi:MAG: HEAT repeat domain-containing protein [Singulisphaera sp.]
MSESPLASERRVGYLKALTQATRQRKVRPPGDLARLGRLLEGPDEALREAAARAAGLWGVEPLRTKLMAIARAEGTRDPLRRAAIDGLEQFGGPSGRQALEELAEAKGPDRTRDLALAALVGLDPRAFAPRALARLAEAPNSEDVEAILTRFLRRRDGPDVLVTALAGRKLPADVAKVGMRVSRASGLEVPALIEALRGAGGLSAGPAVLTPEAMNGLVADVSARGEARRGEAIFRRKDLDCLKCHALAGAGGQVGPGLESVGASAPVDYLVDSLLQPDKAIKENFHAVVVATSDGRIATGIKVRQSDTELVLRDADDRELVLPLDAIEEQKPGGSLMPAGLTDTLDAGGTGRPGPVPLRTGQDRALLGRPGPRPQAVAGLAADPSVARRPGRHRTRRGGLFRPSPELDPGLQPGLGRPAARRAPAGRAPRAGAGQGIRTRPDRRLDRGESPIAPPFDHGPGALDRRRPPRAEGGADRRPRGRDPHRDLRRRPRTAPRAPSPRAQHSWHPVRARWGAGRIRTGRSCTWG